MSAGGWNRPWTQGDEAHCVGITGKARLLSRLEGTPECPVWWKVSADYKGGDGSGRRAAHWMPEGALSVVPWTEEPVAPAIGDGVYIVQQTQRSDLSPTVRRRVGSKWFFTRCAEGYPAGEPSAAPEVVISRLAD